MNGLSCWAHMLIDKIHTSALDQALRWRGMSRTNTKSISIIKHVQILPVHFMAWLGYTSWPIIHWLSCVGLVFKAGAFFVGPSFNFFGWGTSFGGLLLFRRIILLEIGRFESADWVCHTCIDSTLPVRLSRLRIRSHVITRSFIGGLAPDLLCLGHLALGSFLDLKGSLENPLWIVANIHLRLFLNFFWRYI